MERGIVGQAESGVVITQSYKRGLDPESSAAPRRQ
jgi:hypothetical protein